MKPETVHRSAGVEVVAVPLLQDNYAYLILAGSAAAVVDPAEAEPLLRLAAERRVPITHIFITHPHRDHTAGVDDLRIATGALIVAPANASVEPLSHPMNDGDQVHVGTLAVQALDTPGHCASHVSYHAPDEYLLFSGDCLFVAGCGRLLGQRPETLFHSLRKLAALPDETRVFCGHEYALENLRFATSVDPANAEARKWLREVEALRRQGRPAVPSTIGREKLANPFLRAADVPAFARLRSRKDVF